jgi:CheY-like chemotaxis protein
LKKVKQDAELKNIPAIMITNVQEELDNAVKAGAEEALLKSSLVPSQIIEVCKKYLNLPNDAEATTAPVS